MSIIFNQTLLVGTQPNIHPGCISSTGRNGRVAAASTNQLLQMVGGASVVAGGAAGTTGGVTNSISGGLSSVSLGGLNIASNNILMAAATSTQNAAAQQLIGGAMSPSMFAHTAGDAMHAIPMMLPHPSAAAPNIMSQVSCPPNTRLV